MLSILCTTIVCVVPTVYWCVYMKLCLHGLVYLGWIMDYVPFLIFLLYLYMYLLCDNKRFWTFELWTYMLVLVHFSVEVCLKGVFPHFVSTRRDPCVRVYAPLTLAPPPRKKTKSNRGDPALHLHQARGHLNWRMGLPALLGGNLGCWIA